MGLLDTKGQYVDHNFWEGDGGYLGIPLSIDGWTHDGWVKVTRECGAALAWAYETTPGAPISVPLPAPGAAAIWFVFIALQGRPRRT